MIKIFNTNNYIITEITNKNDITTDIKGENVNMLSNMLISIMKSYKDLGLNKEDLLALIEISYEEKTNS